MEITTQENSAPQVDHQGQIENHRDGVPPAPYTDECFLFEISPRKQLPLMTNKLHECL